MRCEVIDICPGLWIWRLGYPDWREDVGWEQVVSSTCVESRGEVLLIDPLAPPEDATEVWERLDARAPTAVVILKPDHVRDVDLFVRRYGARAFGPWLFWRSNIPEVQLEPIEPGSELPGGLVALYDGRGRNETPVWLPEQRTLVFADGMTGQGGELRIWDTPAL
jgi:glyoxylase-like metal-dependent hydrolase (beta-lactamase superfamily II)